MSEWDGAKKHGVFRDGYFCCAPLWFCGAVTNTRIHWSSVFSLSFILPPPAAPPLTSPLSRATLSQLIFIILFIYIFFFFCRFTLHLILSPRLVGVCVCGAAVISEEESECKREGGEPLSCVRASATGMERLVGGWGRRRQRHLWSGPTNLIFHVSPSRSHSLRTKLSHKNVYFVSPHICF